MNWPIWLLVIALVGLMVGWFVTRSLLFLPLTALVVYLAVDFSVVAQEHPGLWDFVRVSFWILVILAAIAFVIAKAGLLFFVGAFALAGIVGTSIIAAWYYHDEDDASDVEVADASADSTTTTTTEPSPEEDARECPDTWKIVQADNDNNRWFADGLVEIREADTDAEAREATRTWLRLVRRDPHLLAGASAYFLDRPVKASELVSEDGKCATEAAEMLTSEIELAIAEAKVTPDDAPADGVNSGTDTNGNVVAAEHAGLTGDRAAVQVVLKDGKTIWIMARCGNPVTKGPAPVPPGPTDQPPPPPGTVPPGTVPPGTTPPGTVPPGTTPPGTVPPGTTPTTTTTPVARCPNGTQVPPNGLCPKDPSKSTNNNPAIPAPVRKTQPSPDNQTEADKPPREPVDSPTGCSGRCDQDDGFQPTTTTTQPRQGQGDSGDGATNTTTPPTTQAPAPAPPTTQSPSPATTNPLPPPG